MDEDERMEALGDALNRAADLAESIAAAFRFNLGGSQQTVIQASRALKSVARKIGV